MVIKTDSDVLLSNVQWKHLVTLYILQNPLFYCSPVNPYRFKIASRLNKGGNNLGKKVANNIKLYNIVPSSYLLDVFHKNFSPIEPLQLTLRVLPCEGIWPNNLHLTHQNIHISQQQPQTQLLKKKIKSFISERCIQGQVLGHGRTAFCCPDIWCFLLLQLYCHVCSFDF